MPTRGRIAAAGLTLAVLTAAPFAQAPPPSGTAFIVGQVVDAVSDRPLAGATVRISGGGGGRGGPPEILTGGDGYFLFRDLPAGRYSVSATKSGYILGSAGQRRPVGSWRPLSLANGEHAGPVSIRLWRSGALSGTVLDETGEPIVAAHLQVLRQARRSGYETLVSAATTQTDDRGMYRVGGLAPGSYAVVLSARRAGSLTTLAREVTQWRSRVVLPEPGMPGQQMLVAREAPPESAVLVYPTTFHPDTLTAEQAQLVLVSPGSEASGVDLRVTPGLAYTVSGRLVTGQSPAGGVMVRLIPEVVSRAPTVSGEIPAVRTSGDGSFLFPFVPEGNYRLRASTGPGGPRPAPGQSLWWADAPVSVGRAPLSDLVVPLQPGLRIRGRFVFEGSGTPGAPPPDLSRVPIVVESTDPSADPFQATESLRANAAGEFESGERIPGRYFVRVSGSPEGWMFKGAYAGGLDASDTPLDLAFADENDVVITFTDQWTGLRGMVRGPDGTADPAATVVLYPMNTQAWEGPGYTPRRFRTSLGQPDGSFNLTSIPPGDYYVVAIPEVDAAGWNDPDSLLGLMRDATRVTVQEGEQRTLDLRTGTVR